jgi:hypothetical protein
MGDFFLFASKKNFEVLLKIVFVVVARVLYFLIPVGIMNELAVW